MWPVFGHLPVEGRSEDPPCDDAQEGQEGGLQSPVSQLGRRRGWRQRGQQPVRQNLSLTLVTEFYKSFQLFFYKNSVFKLFYAKLISKKGVRKTSLKHTNYWNNNANDSSTVSKITMKTITTSTTLTTTFSSTKTKSWLPSLARSATIEPRLSPNSGNTWLSSIKIWWEINFVYFVILALNSLLFWIWMSKRSQRKINVLYIRICKMKWFPFVEGKTVICFSFIKFFWALSNK